jgi:class 3 adenylate cyclase
VSKEVRQDVMTIIARTARLGRRDILTSMVGEYSRGEAANRAGVDSGYIDRLIELGIIEPDAAGRLTKGDVRRAQMAQTLEAAGIALETLAASIRDDNLSLGFMDAPTYERFATLSDETFEGLSERTALPLDLLMLIREAAGGAMPDPDDRIREDELAVVPLIEAGLAMGFRPISIARRLRVLGDSLRRVAETEADAYRTDLMEPMLADGATAADLSATSTSADTLRLDQAMDEALIAIWHAQQVRPWTADIIAIFEKSMTDAGRLLAPSSRPPAICFLDITGYTRLTHDQGDNAAAELAEDLGRLVQRTAMQHGGRPVKWLGDGVMIFFRDSGSGVLAALEMVEGIASAGLPPAHVGLHAGPVLSQEGDYFGETVNLASRIAAYARPREILVTQKVVDESAAIGAIFTEIGPVELKGIPGVIRLHAAHRLA